MPANLSFDILEAAVTAGTIDTVLTCLTDMQGRLIGKRFHAAHFVDGAICRRSARLSALQTPEPFRKNRRGRVARLDRSPNLQGRVACL